MIIKDLVKSCDNCVNNYPFEPETDDEENPCDACGHKSNWKYDAYNDDTDNQIEVGEDT